MFDTPSVTLDRPTPSASRIDAPAHRRIFLVVVDDTRECQAALKYACLRARNSGGRVALLAVAPVPEAQHWMFIGNLMQEEACTEAEERLQQVAAEVHASSGERPELYVRQGDSCQELCALIEENDAISVVVLGVGFGPEGPGPLVEAVTGRNAGRLRVPVTLVPGDLSPQDLEAIT